MTMQEEIGTAAGSIWQALNTRGELSLAQLKKELKAKTPLFDRGIGWLAREDRIAITPEKNSFRVRLREATGDCDFCVLGSIVFPGKTRPACASVAPTASFRPKSQQSYSCR
jgi:Winged helix-turn-helix domain (DUF2582)